MCSVEFGHSIMLNSVIFVVKFSVVVVVLFHFPSFLSHKTNWSITIFKKLLDKNYKQRCC